MCVMWRIFMQDDQMNENTEYLCYGIVANGITSVSKPVLWNTE